MYYHQYFDRKEGGEGGRRGAGDVWASKELTEGCVSFGDVFKHDGVSALFPFSQEKAETLADNVDEFTALLFSMPLAAPPATANTAPIATGLAILQDGTSKCHSKFQVPSLSANTPRKPLSQTEAARKYRELVAIPRYLEKRSRRKWVRGLMHPSRSAAAHRRQRIGGKFGLVSKNPESPWIELVFGPGE